MAGYFQDHGYVVRRLDLTNLNKSDGWDCMRSIKPWNADLDAQMFAQTVIANTVDDLTSIYATGPMSLLKALILRVYLGHDFPEEMKNIGTVYSLLQNPQGESFLDAMFDSSQLTEEEMPCLGPYLSFKQGSPNLRGNLITNLSVQLQLLQNKLVCKVLSTDDIDLLLPGQQPCAYFCLFPDSHDTFRFIVSLFFSMFFTNLISYADQKCGGALPIPVNFLLDEFPSIGHLPDWDRKMATIRKRNLAAVMIFQNITQLQNLYDTTWTTILSNCATMVSLGINDGDTAEMWSKRIGDTTIQAQTEQHPAQEALFAFAHSHSEGEGRRALLSYDELHKIDQDDCIILFQGHNPIWARKYPHTLHPESHKLRTIYPDDIPDITDFTARKARREQENERVADYLKKHPLPSPEDRKYKGLCEPDPEESIRSSVWNKAREELFRFRTGLDKRDEDGKHDAVSKGNLKDGTAVSVREIETITFADEEKENDLNDIVFKKAMVPETDMVLEEGNVDNDVREDTVPKEPDSGQGTQNDAHEKAAAAKAPPVNVAELFSSVSADLPSQQQENRQNGEKEVLAAMRGRRQSGRTIRFSSTVNRPKGGQQDRTPPVMEGSVPPGKRKDEMK